MPNFVRRLAAFAIAAILSGCVTGPASRPTVATGVPAGQGLVLFGYATPATRILRDWSIEVDRVIPGTEKLAKDAPDQSAILFETSSGYVTSSRHYASYALPPGEYAITNLGGYSVSGLRATLAGKPVTIVTTSAAAMISAVIVPLAVPALMEKAEKERAAEVAEFGPPQPSIFPFTLDDKLSDRAVRFTVAAGEAVYLGDFLFGLTRYGIATGENKIGHQNAGVSGSSTKDIEEPFLQYRVDEAGARAELARLKLGQLRLRTASIDRYRVDVVPFFPSNTPDRIAYRAKGRIAETVTVSSLKWRK